MSPFVLTALLFSLSLGTTLTFASSHWLLAWMGLELNTMAILPLMAQNHHPRAIEATTKYFLTQATAAAMILFASITNAWILGEWNIQLTSHPLATTMIMLALSLKVGLAPMHFWLPEVLQGLDLTTGLILSTWQKLAPFALILQLSSANSSLLIFLGLTSTLVGGWGGLNQTQTRKILAYSSIAHLGWMILIIKFTPHLTLLALLLYVVMTSSVFLTLKLTNGLTINTLATSWTKAPAISTIAPLALLSLGGLPPLSGFMPKWLILQELAKQHLPLTATLAALSALLSLFFYLRVSYSMTLTMSPNTVSASAPWRLQNHQFTLLLAFMTTLTILLLPITPTILSILPS
uniref:NADH-ubiquinone oxidoreductase chain 2 n=1 Tax=Harpadon microchir TaxID=143314 RepID=Q94TE2_HARMI|nr:NADH dehydrogenase subunit 2 [Harpadon microchir]BAB70028.1 NADH dehydrogenase subunit 2 [Harpadon microchir]